MSLRRSLGVALWASVLVACGALTGLDDYSEGAALSADGGPGSGSSSGSSSASSGSSSGGSSSGGSSSGGSSSSSGGSSSGVKDAAVDTWVDPCAGKVLIDGICTKNQDCCSNKCNYDGRCKSDCKVNGIANCAVDQDCCVTYYCARTGVGIPTGCAACKNAGQGAEIVNGTPRKESCCSKALSGNNCQ